MNSKLVSCMMIVRLQVYGRLVIAVRVPLSCGNGVLRSKRNPQISTSGISMGGYSDSIIIVLCARWSSQCDSADVRRESILNRSP
jgi:hypothetical protein